MSGLASWMKFSVHFTQPLARNVGINFGGAYARVAEQLLDDSQVRSILQQVRSKAVPEHVRR